jgi:toxin-antitoxin system PIN domain toxin
VVALVDASILVALFDPDHAKHQIAHDWFEDQQIVGWATCPLTENALVRILSGPTFFDPPHRPADLVTRLRRFRQAGVHHFWPDSISLADSGIFEHSMIRGSKQVTDIYLLGLAKTMSGTLATLDHSIPLAAVKGATKANLQIISSAD